MTNEEYIKEALHRDVDLPVEEYKAKCAAADRNTKTHGVEGCAPISEAVRHKRIQTNFYGTALNVLLSILTEITHTNDILAELTVMTHMGLSPAAKAQYEAFIKCKNGERSANGK